MTQLREPFDLEGFIAENAHRLKPPVSNMQIWEDSDMIVMLVGGGNERTDYHDDPNPEFFHQLAGTMTLRVIEAEGQPPRDLVIGAGDVFLLPAHVRHSPQRKDPDGIGIVVEYARREGDVDGFEWYCPNCHRRIHRVELQLDSIVDDLPPLFAAFNADETARTCGHCGTVHPVEQ